ncbi:MAG: radical SAM protein [Candidatus Omnitrophica bacterium]|nr:radical SAM protein [Candidatus Omnitrophota bacterium]
MASFGERYHVSKPAENLGLGDGFLKTERYARNLFDPLRVGLPLEMASQCLYCARIVKGTVLRKDNVIYIDKTCPEHGPMLERLNDSLFTEGAKSDIPGSPCTTYSGSRIHPVVRSIPRTVETLCPICRRNILGRIFEWEGKVYMEKTCPDHGYVKDMLNSDAWLYKRLLKYSYDEGPGLTNPNIAHATHCPTECGLCNQHQSHTVLANIDLTNRCNLKCPICFANASVQGYVYEPTFEEIVDMLKALRSERPVACVAVQFSGGEPTLHPRFMDIIRRAVELGFTQRQIATNGIRHADYDFAKEAKEAGLHTLYLQFDGVGKEPYLETRGCDIWETKLKTIENCRKLGYKICLVPTIVKGINDGEVGKILKFACENSDVISGISYQPVAFTGRISLEEREAKRFTLGDLAHGIAETGYADVKRDFFPVSIMMPFSHLMSAFDKGAPKPTISCHPDCGMGTYFLIDHNNNPVPFPKFLDIDGLFADINRKGKKWRKSRSKVLNAFRMWLLFMKHFRPEGAPEGLTVFELLKALLGLVDKRFGRGKTGSKNWRTMLAAGMHFQDCYNYDVERAKRCVIHYSTPQGIYPFCTYNGGPTFRPAIERRFSVPLEVYLQNKKSSS